MERYILFSNTIKWSATPEDKIGAANSLKEILALAIGLRKNFMIIIDRYNPVGGLIKLEGDELEHWTADELIKLFSLED